MGTTMSSTLSPPLMTPTPAAQKVFCLHELVAQILSHLPHLYGAYAAESWEPVPWTANDTTNKGTRQHHAALIKLAQINTVWFNEAMRILWKEGTEIKQRSMIGLLENVQEEGRQFYAAFIKTAIIFDPHKGKVLASNKIIAGLDFSRLQYLSIILPNTQGTQKLCLPAIRAPQLKVLDIRRVASPLTQKLDSRKQSKEISQVWNPGYCRLRSLTMRSAETLVRVIKRRFKNLEKITFGPELQSTRKVMLYFSCELPSVKITFYKGTYNPANHNRTLQYLDRGSLMRKFPGTRLLV